MHCSTKGTGLKSWTKHAITNNHSSNNGKLTLTGCFKQEMMVRKEQLCLCQMCKCGHHRCPQQDAKELRKIQLKDFEMSDATNQKWETEDVTRNKYQQIHDQPPESNMYTSSTYREDFQVKTKTAGTSEPSKLVSSLKCETDAMQTYSTYSWDFVPWIVEDMKVCRSFLPQDHVESPDNTQMEKNESFDISKLKPEVAQRLYEYYCPPHCLGNEKKPPDQNCLLAYKDKFNLGPPQKRKSASLKKSSRPISKFTNYSLDYVPHKLEPRKQDLDSTRTQPPPPRTLDTTHKADYICWPPDNYTANVIHTKSTNEGKKQTLKTGLGGSMVTQSIHAMDYKDPNVTGHMPVRPPAPDPFRPPLCRMESETTTGTSFPRWREVPPQLASTLSSGTGPKPSSDTRCFVTMYQQDFDDLREVLCPAKKIEKYGRKILEPKCSFIGAENEHEYYRCKEKQFDHQ